MKGWPTEDIKEEIIEIQDIKEPENGSVLEKLDTTGNHTIQQNTGELYLLIPLGVIDKNAKICRL